MDQVLPPLPPSDVASLEKNYYDPYYKYNSRNFWKDAEITRVVDVKKEKCLHEFRRTHQGAECKKCHFGLIGFFEVRSGHLYIKGEKVNF